MNTTNNFLAIMLIFGFFTTINSGCEKDKNEDPGPISVENTITPSVVSNGETIQWEIKINNLGGDVEIETVHLREEFISGWAEGQGTAEMDLPLSNIKVDAHSSKIIYSYSAPVFNTGWTDIEVKNTVSVTSNGGSGTDFTIYKITMDSKNYVKSEAKSSIASTIHAKEN